MAISLIIYSLYYLINFNLKKFLISIIIATFFHKTSIIFILAYPLYKYVLIKKDAVLKLSLVLVLLAIIFVPTFSLLIDFFIKIGLISSKYLYYITHYRRTNINFEVVEILLDLLMLSIYILFQKKYDYTEKISRLYFIFLLFDMILLIVDGMYSNMRRLGLYFRFPAILFFLSSFELIFKKNKKFFSKFFSLSICFVFWYYLFILQNVSSTYPYKIRLLNVNKEEYQCVKYQL